VQLVPQCIVFESIFPGPPHHEFLAIEGWWANADGRGLTTTYSYEVLRREERTGDTGAWAVSIIATGMPAKKQVQFRAGIKANRKPWDSKVEFTMPGELKLYRDYELTGESESEYASAAGKKGAKKGGKIGSKIDAKPETKERLNYALNPKNKDGYDPKWQQCGKKGEGWRDGREARDEGAPQRLNYALNPKNKDGFDSKWQHNARLALAATRTNCITCKMVPRAHKSDKCYQCQLAVFNM
jgi:hypothetical protein